MSEIEQTTPTQQKVLKSGYVNGSDMLIGIGGRATGHATSHRVSLSAETKDRAVKPAAKVAISRGLWKNKGVVALSVTISAEGLCFYAETESGYKEIAALAFKGQSVDVKCFERSEDDAPYLSGKFIITSLDRDDPANDDSTYSVTLENDGEVEFDEDALSSAVIAELDS